MILQVRVASDRVEVESKQGLDWQSVLVKIVPYTYLKTTPLIPGVSPVKIHYRIEGEGETLLVLHGGWGYGVYPFDRQIAALRTNWKVLVPDRSGYGRSTRVDSFPSDFHYRAADETLEFMDELRIDRPVIWGHSDGAVIGAILGIIAPDRIRGLILESFHYYRVKNHSCEFFEKLAFHPETLGESLCAKFEAEHGKEYWKTIISSQAKAWFDLAATSKTADDDLYGGRLDTLQVPTLFIHGRHDPRTEPNELDAVRRAVRKCDMRILDAHHSPHSEPATADLTTRIALEFLRQTN